MAIAVGIDVGGPSKGFHAVALDGDRVLKVHALEAIKIAEWCSSVGARAIAIDAPAGWRTGPGLRLAERELQERGLHFFATPSREKSSSPFYTWMHNGFALYEALAQCFPRITRDSTTISSPVCFETFPHAIAHALFEGRVPAGSKVRVRRKLLADCGLRVGELSNVDLVDAGLCAYTARRFLMNRGGDVQFLGDRDGGFLVIPSPTGK